MDHQKRLVKPSLKRKSSLKKLGSVGIALLIPVSLLGACASSNNGHSVPSPQQERRGSH